MLLSSKDRKPQAFKPMLVRPSGLCACLQPEDRGANPTRLYGGGCFHSSDDFIKLKMQCMPVWSPNIYLKKIYKKFSYLGYLRKQFPEVDRFQFALLI